MIKIYVYYKYIYIYTKHKEIQEIGTIWTAPHRRREALQLRRDLSLGPLQLTERSTAPRVPLSSDLMGFTMDWFKGKSTGNHGFYHQI